MWGVLQVRGGRDLGEEALGSDDRREFGTQDFERDFALVLDVLGQVDGRHAAFTEFALDAVLAVQGGVEAFGVAFAHGILRAPIRA